MSRATWVAGYWDRAPNYQGRHCMVWREHEHVLTSEGVGNDHPDLFPFEVMSIEHFVPAMCRVRVWQFDWSVSMDFPTSGFSHTASGTVLAVPRATNAPITVPPTPAALGTHEEHRLLAGYQFSATATTEVPGEPSAVETQAVQVGGVHQYLLPPVDAVPLLGQRFRPRVGFRYSLDLAPDAPGSETIDIGPVGTRAGASSVGTATFALPSWDETQMTSFASTADMTALISGTSVLIGAATISATLSIAPASWWEYGTPTGENPLFRAADGAPLNGHRLEPSSAVRGRRVATGLVGVRFSA